MRILLLTAVLAAVCAAAEDSYDIKVYPCPKATGVIAVDGRLDEPDWQSAPLVTGFTFYNKPEPAPVQTYLRALYDDGYLYFGIICDEPLVDKLAPVAYARDTHAIFAGETLEIFVDPKHDLNYFQFGVNAAGSVWDSRGNDTSWDAQVLAKAAVDPAARQWRLEFAIPWKDLGVPPDRGRVVGFNVCRDRLLGTEREWSNWSQTQANFHDPERFAHVVLAPTADQLARLGAEFRKGDRRGRLVVYSSEGFANATYRGMAREAVDKLEAELAALAGAVDEQSDPAAAAELSKLLAGYRAEIAPFRQQLAGEAPLDAAAWTKVDLRVSQLSSNLGQAVWEARLAALLAGL